jgi:hypothetical protein
MHFMQGVNKLKEYTSNIRLGLSNCVTRTACGTPDTVR